MNTSRERTSVIAASLTASVMIAQQVAGKATRDALFLSSYQPSELPKAMLVAALASFVGVGVMSKMLAKFGPSRVMPTAFVLSGGLFVGEWFVSSSNPGAAAWLVYLHLAAFGAIVISGFWSLISERFNPHTAKRQMARIGSGAAFGGVLGGLGAERVAATLDVRTTLLILAVLNVACALGVRGVGRARDVRPIEKEKEQSGLDVLRTTPYLRKLSAMVVLVALSAALLDYAFKAGAVTEYGDDGEALMQFFAIFYTVANVVTFVLQTAFAKRTLLRLGLGGTMALLPLSVVAFGAFAAGTGRLWSLALAKAAEVVVANSFFRSAYELLFTPLPAEQKRPAKTIVDVASERAGGALGAVIVWSILTLSTAFATEMIMGLAMLSAGVALWTARHVHHGYIGALADSLRSGAVRLKDSEVMDSTTQRTLAETTMSLNREKLLKEIRLLRASERPAGTESEDGLPLPAPAPLVGLADNLGDVDELLASRPFPLGGVAFVVPLLADRTRYKDVIKTLSTLAERIVGQLLDALLDPEQPLVVRRRVPRILAACDGRRAVAGLYEGLGDERFEVRYECAQALASIFKRTPAAMTLTPTQVFDAVLREVGVGKNVWDRQALLDDDSDRPQWLDSAVRARVHRSVEHIFVLLGLTLEREPLEMALAAFSSDDENLRGTALEYLEVVLPPNVRTLLWPLLAPSSRPAPRGRPREKVLKDLLTSMGSMPIDRKALKKK